MAVKTINTEMLQKMFLAGAANLEAKKEYINELNVFPVPDGDTGTNMTLTIMSAAKEVQALIKPDMVSMAKAISSGSLRGARGNSGVILSQLLRGFTKEIREHNEIDTVILAKACDRAAATAYKAVMKPKEGTILTGAKGISQKAAELAETTDDLEVFLPEVIRHAEEVLAQTPDMLPVLKEAGVVDSGGQGLLEVLHGAYDAFLGKEIDYTAIEASSGTKMVKPAQQAETDIKFGYCTEFIIMTEKEFTDKDEAEFKGYLESIGDSIVCVADDDIVKIHVHTNDPGLAIQKALTYGQLSRMKIDNMREEHQEKLIRDAEKVAAQQKEEEAQKKKKEPRKSVGFIAVSIGEGMNDIFRELGVDYIIEGGQTMNPSTDDILQAVEATPARHVFVLPNNKNIIMAAEQAVHLADRGVSVVATKTIPQGITAMLSFDPEADADANSIAMMEAAGRVSTGLVTFAARNSDFDGHKIKKGEIMAMENGKIVNTGTDITKMTYRLARSMVKKDSSFITLISGCDVSEEDAQRTCELVQSKVGDGIEVTLINGGQPVYYYMIGVE